MKNLLDLSGRSAVIFGGTGNLGSFITKKLYENGAKVAVSYYFDREAEIAQKQLVALDPTGEKVFAGYADIADRDSVEAFVADVRRKFSTIDIMVKMCIRDRSAYAVNCPANGEGKAAPEKQARSVLL